MNDATHQDEAATLAALLAELTVTTSKAKRKDLREQIEAIQHRHCNMPCGPGCPAF